MSFFVQHIQRILDTYEGHPPLSLFLRQYFKSYPKLGSRDRRALSEATFIYFRCRRFFSNTVSSLHVIAAGYKRCNSKNAFLEKMLQEYFTEDAIGAPVLQTDILTPLSGDIQKERWLRSLWQQPQLFIRLRNDKEKALAALRQHDIAFDTMQDINGGPADCLRIQNGKSIDTILDAADYVVQDWSSQQSIYILRDHLEMNPAKVWDVCSGAGGKSILLKDILPPFDLTVSDIRATILHNLSMRFKQYGLGKIKQLEVNAADAHALQEKSGNQEYDLIICDVPCSGSGTWARTPEQFHFYKREMLQKFKELQFSIASNASRYLRSGGYFAYITCSMFREENEDVVDQLLKLNTLTLKHRQIIDGIEEQADCMFIAIFEKL